MQQGPDLKLGWGLERKVTLNAISVIQIRFNISNVSDLLKLLHVTSDNDIRLYRGDF